MTMPNFIIAGAPKCGTTALAALLDQHPEVGLTTPKEPAFFTHTPLASVKVVGRNYVPYKRGIEWYEGLFAPIAHLPARGEASTYYFALEDTPELLMKHCPDIKLIFLLRDPAERAYSHYIQDMKSGVRLPPFEAILDENSTIGKYVHVSRYRIHLRRFLNLFDANQLRVYLMDDLKANPKDVLTDVCHFLDVDPPPSSLDYGKNYNPRKSPRSRVIQRLLLRARSSAISQIIPAAIRRPMAKTAQAMWKFNLKPTKFPEMLPEVRTRLVRDLHPDIEFVEALLGHELPGWKETFESPAK